MAFSPDGKTLALASTDNTIKLWRSRLAAYELHSMDMQATSLMCVSAPMGELSPGQMVFEVSALAAKVRGKSNFGTWPQGNKRPLPLETQLYSLPSGPVRREKRSRLLVTTRLLIFGTLKRGGSRLFFEGKQNLRGH
ncbi:MAG: hypothetical protein ACFCD0_20500 [Gemmataceae bacterium]